ncbi:hypothetical protein K1719_026301 [Acacia pycnantha]|nr:hypothetical protein K1719_026301 [Acacia pycnantha]
MNGLYAEHYHDVLWWLRWLVVNSTRRLDIIARYWQLVAFPHDSHSGDYGYSENDMRKFGVPEGATIYKAIDAAAADHNVKIRLLSHSGVYPDFTTEPSHLASGRSNVKNVTLLLRDWWGSDIVHAKVWISDNRDIYIGSANNDWKSLTQVIMVVFSKHTVIFFCDPKNLD